MAEILGPPDNIFRLFLGGLSRSAQAGLVRKDPQVLPRHELVPGESLGTTQLGGRRDLHGDAPTRRGRGGRYDAQPTGNGLPLPP